VTLSDTNSISPLELTMNKNPSRA